VYYTNLGKTYEKIGYDDLARHCFEKAVSLNVLCFDYYLNLAKNYKNLGLLDEKITLYQEKKDSPLNEVILGLLYIEKGQNEYGVYQTDVMFQISAGCVLIEYERSKYGKNFYTVNTAGIFTRSNKYKNSKTVWL
jgi:tetratricopeptide (TPR) repeat protein